MTEEEKRILNLANQVNLALRNEYIDSDEEQEHIDKTIDWVNQFLPELEGEALWRFSRENDAAIGVVNDRTERSYELDESIRLMVANTHRDLTIRHDGTIVSRFKVVNPNQIYDPSDSYAGDRAMQVGRRFVLSRELTEAEEAGDIVADVIHYIPRLERENVEALDIIEPLQLVVLGVLKNMSLSGVIDRALSPTFTQKYGDLLEKAKAENDASSAADRMDYEDFSYIRGAW